MRGDGPHARGHVGGGDREGEPHWWLAALTFIESLSLCKQRR